MKQALRLAQRGRYQTAPNPMVGAVIVNAGKVVGTGYHRRAGGAHAEVEALAAAGDRACGATLYVNLEPCNHHGRTPPCVQALLKAGIAKVVAAHRDPNPRVSGGGFDVLREQGAAVEVGVLAEEAVRLNLNYLVAQTLSRPSVTLKWAMSLDGRIATATGESQWISSPPARRWALLAREEHDALLVGSGTAIADDPRLNRRLSRAATVNTRVVLDRRLRLRPEARMFQLEGPVVIYTESAQTERQRRLERVGATVVVQEQVTPQSVLNDLRQRGVQSVLVEGGSHILAAFAEAGLFDRVAVTCAPMLIGGQRAPAPLGGNGWAGLDQAPRLAGMSTRRCGTDVILLGYRDGCLPDLLQSVVG